MYHPRHLQIRRRWLDVALVLCALVTVAAAARIALVGGQQAPTGRSEAGAPPAGASATTGLEQCAAVRRSQALPLRAAARSLAQWKVHVGAMNQLVAGRITLAQATAFWARTRVGAARRVRQFHDADSATLSATGCGRAMRAGGEGTACARDVERRAATLEAARTAIRTWQRHIKDMERLRTGRMTPAQATQMWLMNWRTGVRQLDAYHAALRRSVHGPACPAA